MKRIHALLELTDGLAEYLAEEGASATWAGFGSHRGSSDTKRKLTDVLTELQHGLCGYCEIDLRPMDRQVEHVVPQTDDRESGRRLALVVSNMIACCTGNAPHSYVLDIRGDPSRYLRPLRKHLSCGQSKGATSDPDFLDPRSLPELPSLLRVLDNGEIEPDPDACDGNGIDTRCVWRTIEILGLNVPRLVHARARHWRGLQEGWGDHVGDSAVFREGARGELLPDASGALPPFFTTARSYFGAVAEEILGDPPRSWI